MAGHQDLDDLLQAAAGEPLDAPSVLAEVWSQVNAGIGLSSAVADGQPEHRRLDVIARAPTASRRRHRLVRGASLTTAVVLAGGGVAAAADFIATRTGERAIGWEIRAGGAGEILNMGGTDFPEVARQVTADIPFAPGGEGQRQVALDDSFLTPQAGVSISEGAVRTNVAGYAICSWAAYWVTADAAADATARALATDTLSRSLTWDVVNVFETEPSPVWPDGTAEYPLDFYDWLPVAVDAAQAGDRRRLLLAMESSTQPGCLVRRER